MKQRTLTKNFQLQDLLPRVRKLERKVKVETRSKAAPKPGLGKIIMI